MRHETAARGGVVLIARFAVIALLNYALGVILAWLLPQEEYGRVSAIQAALLLGAYTLNSGFPWIVAWTEARRERLERRDVAAVLRTSLLGNWCLGLLLAFVFVVLQALGVRLLPPGSTLMVALVAASFPFFAVNSVLKGAIHGRRRFSSLFLVQAAEVLVKCLVAVVLVVALHFGALAVAIAFLVGAVAATFIGAWRLRDDLPARRGPLAGLETYRSAAPMFVGSAGFALFSTADILGLQSIGHAYGFTPAIVATYQVAVLLGRAPYFVADALADAVFPFIAGEHDSPEGSHKWFASAARWVLLAVVPIELVMAVRPQPFLELFFPAGYDAAVPLVRLVAFGAIGMIGCGIYGKSLQALGRRDAPAKVMPVVLIVELAALAVLVPRLAALGAAIAFSAAGWTGALLLAATYYRHQRVRLPQRQTVWRYVFAVLALLVGVALVPRLPAVGALAAVSAVAMGYIALARLLGLITADDIAHVRRAAAKLRPRRASTSLDGEQTDPPAPSGGTVWSVLKDGTASVASRMSARPALLALALGAVAAVPFLANIMTSPDTQYDEVVYTRAAQEVIATGRLSWSAEPVFVHPPLYFLLQSGWLAVLHLGNAQLFEAIHAARIVTASFGAVNAVLLGMLAFAVTPAARPRRRLILVAAVVALAATDPVLLRYSRLAIIEPLALFGCLLTLLVSWRARRWRAARHVVLVGLLTGLTLLVKEISIFLLLAPVAFGLIRQSWPFLRRAVASLAIGIGFWLVFPLWAAQLGVFGRFWEVKVLTVQRLLGLLQVTGWNRPGVSFVDAVTRSAPQYLTSYLLLALGALALLWLFLRRNHEAASYVFVLLACSYAFAAYTVVQGTLNEQFFVYVVPAAILGAVLWIDALLAALVSRTAGRSPVAALPALLGCGGIVGLVALIFVGAGASWRYQYGHGRNDGIEQMAAFVESRYPACAAFNTSGDAQKYVYSLQGRSVTRFGSGPGALSHGIHYFFLNPKDAVSGYGRMSPDLARWIRSYGRPVTSFPSNTYQGVQLWEVRSDQYDRAADVEQITGGVFVHTVGSRCGGYSVKNDPNGLFLREYQALGGKAVVGAPISRTWREGDRTLQAFNGVILETRRAQPGRPPAVRAVSAVARLAKQSPVIYQRYQLPAVRYADTPRLTAKQVLARLNDVRIARAYLGVPRAQATASDVTRALNHLGAPLGPAVRMPDGAVRQPFAKVVFERPANAPDVVRLAEVGRALTEALHRVPSAAVEPQRPPALPLPSPARRPAEVEPFASSLIALVLSYLAVVGVLTALWRRRRPAPATSVVPAEVVDKVEEPVP